MKVQDIMSSPVVVVHEEDTLETAARIMLDRSIGGVPVVDADGRAVGFVTDSDFAAKKKGIPFGFMTAPQVLGEWLGKEGVERIYHAARSRPVREIMTSPVVVVEEDATVEDAVRRMLDRDVNRIVVVRDRKPVGIVARHDLLRLVMDRGVG